MAFKGTRRRSARDIVVEIEDVGGFLNAYTGREQTAYYAKELGEDTPLVVDIFADILQNSVLDQHKLDREEQVIVQEIGAARDNPIDHVLVRDAKGLRPGGFGVLTVRASVDELVYNQKQNEVIFIKYLS